MSNNFCKNFFVLINSFSKNLFVLRGNYLHSLHDNNNNNTRNFIKVNPGMNDLKLQP